MSTWYVATHGSDGNPGTQAAPFLTIQKAVNAQLAGDSILVEAGTYGPNGAGTGNFVVNINSGASPAGSSGAWSMIIASGTVVLDCESNAHSYFNFQGGSANWKIVGFEIKNGYHGGIWSNSGGGKNIQVLYNSIHDIGRQVNTTTTGQCGIYTDAGAANWIIDGNSIYNVGRTNNAQGGANDPGNSYDHAIYTHGSNMLFQNNLVWNMYCGWHFQTAQGFSGTVINNTFFGPNQYGGKPGQVVLWDPLGLVVVRNNVFYGPNSCGVYNVGATVAVGSSIDHNVLFTPGAALVVVDSLPAGMGSSGNALNANPLLVNPVPGGDYHLKKGSPAIGLGSTVLMPALDHDQVGRTSPDSGAYEFVGVAPPPSPFTGSLTATFNGTVGTKQVVAGVIQG